MKVPHISGGEVEVLMTETERDRCEEHCAQYGDPPCWKLPSKTSDWPKDQPVRPCIDCSDANNEETVQ